MPRGGSRQGTPGKAYANRTDLAQNYASGSPAAGGQTAAPVADGYMRPDDVPNLTDPSAYPERPVTYGLDIGPGAGSEAMPPLMTGAVAVDPDAQFISALMLLHPSADLARLLERYDVEGRR